MQTIFENEDERDYSGETNSISTIICVGKINRHVEGEFIRRFENRKNRIWIS